VDEKRFGLSSGEIRFGLDADAVRAAARELGFERCGIARVQAYPEVERIREWVARGYAAEMAYIGRRLEERADLTRVLEGAQSVIVVAMAYDTGPPDSLAPREPGTAWVSRYAWGADYHETLLERLERLRLALLERCPEARFKGYVDTGPIPERLLAEKAGIGFVGKNTCIIDTTLGSYLFLGVLLTDLELGEDTPIADHCGTCRACLDACPTEAFPEPRVLDARRCIAYWTVEKRGELSAFESEHTGPHVVGCDLCQEVCPWNRRRGRPRTAEPSFEPREGWYAPPVRELLELDASTLAERLRGSAIRRTKVAGLRRNALLAAAHLEQLELLDTIRRYVDDEDPGIRAAARFAVKRLESLRGADRESPT